MAEMETSVGRIAGACRGTIASGTPGTHIRTISSDSRETGDDTLFIPLIGERYDGHEFIAALIAGKKIRGFLSMKDDYNGLAAEHGVASIRCNDTMKALGEIALSRRNEIDPVVVGITGTNGKTTTKELVSHLLRGRYHLLKSEKNYNNEIGVPFTLMNAKPEHRVAVIEMGMNHSGELDRLTRIARPDIALITNVGQGHLEFLGDVENVALAKSEIMHGMTPGSTVIVNGETECFPVLEKKAAAMNLTLKTFGLGADADYHPDGYRLMEHGTELIFRGERINVPLYGIHNLYNMLAAVAVADQFGMKPSKIKESMEGFTNVDGRSQVIESGCLIINDTYNSNPLSLRYALASIREIYPRRRKIAVLSDMKELGESGRFYHRESGRLVADSGFEYLLLWGEMAGVYAEGALSGGMTADRVLVFPDKMKLAETLRAIARRDDVVLVKGSRSMKMEDVVDSMIRSEG